MKLYKPPKPPYLLRINIVRTGNKTEHIAICDATQKELLQFVKMVIEEQKLSPFQKGKVTSVNIREAIKTSLNGKSVSVSFKGLSPNQVKSLILKKLKSHNDN